eukprot:scaffold17838_cov55-Phaeocystis_antarctica.AAC.7
MRWTSTRPTRPRNAGRADRRTSSRVITSGGRESEVTIRRARGRVIRRTWPRNARRNCQAAKAISWVGSTKAPVTCIAMLAVAGGRSLRAASLGRNTSSGGTKVFCRKPRGSAAASRSGSCSRRTGPSCSRSCCMPTQITIRHVARALRLNHASHGGGGNVPFPGLTAPALGYPTGRGFDRHLYPTSYITLGSPLRGPGFTS